MAQPPTPALARAAMAPPSRAMHRDEPARPSSQGARRQYAHGFWLWGNRGAVRSLQGRVPLWHRERLQPGR
jgi:hypothetical protein